MNDIRERWLAAIGRNQRNLTAPGDDRYWAPELNTVSRERLREIQSDKLPAAVAYMAAKSGLYARKLADFGVEPGDIRSVDDLHALPVVTKDDMSESVLANPPGDYTAVDVVSGSSPAGRCSRQAGPPPRPARFGTRNATANFGPGPTLAPCTPWATAPARTSG